MRQEGEEVDSAGTVRFPHNVRSAGNARRHVVGDLAAQGGPPRLVADVALVVSELVANSVRHANPLDGGELEVSWVMTTGGVDLRVTDGGAGATPVLRAVGVDDVSGRGLTIVERVATAWGVESTAFGTTVWASVPGGRRGRSGTRARLA